MSIRRAAAGLTAAILGAFALTAVPPPAAQALPDVGDNKIQIIQHNTDMLGPGPAMQAAADWGGVDAITFQELCKSQVADLNNVGYHVAWRKQRKGAGSRCTKGNAIATVHQITDKRSYGLLKAGGRTFNLLCVDLANTGVANTTVCTSHFPLDYNAKNKAPSGEQNRIKVVSKIRKIVGPWIKAGTRVVLAGDFNDSPKSAPLDRLYKYKGTGAFWEGDQKCGKKKLCRNMVPTTDSGRKLDYFFASARGVDKYRGMSKGLIVDPGHYIVRGQVKFGGL